MPNKNKNDASLFGKFLQRLMQIKMTEFSQEGKLTPQIINMTTSIDHMLNEIHIVFSQVIDELVNTNYLLVERDHELKSLKQINPTGETVQKVGIQDQNSSNIEQLFKEKEEILSQKEEKLNELEQDLSKRGAELKSFESKLSQHEHMLKEFEKKLTSKENELNENELNLNNRSRIIHQEFENIKNQQDLIQKEKRVLDDKMRSITREATSESLLIKTPLISSPSNVNPSVNNENRPLLAPNNSFTDLNQVLKPPSDQVPAKNSQRDLEAEKLQTNYDQIKRRYKDLEFKYEANSHEFQKQIE